MDGGAWWAAVHRVTKSRTQLSDFTFSLSIVFAGEGNGKPLQCSCLENPVDRGAWWAAVHRVTKSWTRLSDSAHMHADLILQVINTVDSVTYDFYSHGFIFISIFDYKLIYLRACSVGIL